MLNYSAASLLISLTLIIIQYHLCSAYVGRRRRRSFSGAEEGSPPMDLYVRKGAIIGVYYTPSTQILSVIGQKTPSSNGRMVCKRAGSLDDNQSINCASSLDTNLFIFAKATIGKCNYNAGSSV